MMDIDKVLQEAQARLENIDIFEFYIPTFSTWCAYRENGLLHLARGLRQPSYWTVMRGNLRAILRHSLNRNEGMSEIERGVRAANPAFEGYALHFYQVQWGEGQVHGFLWFCNNRICTSPWIYGDVSYIPGQTPLVPCLIGLSDEQLQAVLQVAMVDKPRDEVDGFLIRTDIAPNSKSLAHLPHLTPSKGQMDWKEFQSRPRQQNATEP